jgi:hypothetical protein
MMLAPTCAEPLDATAVFLIPWHLPWTGPLLNRESLEVMSSPCASSTAGAGQLAAVVATPAAECFVQIRSSIDLSAGCAAATKDGAPLSAAPLLLWPWAVRYVA